MTTTTNVSQVKLNVMTQAQYDAITPDATELYMITDASVITVDSALSGTSTNPVQNKVVKAALDEKLSSASLATLTDTNISNPTQGQNLTYDAVNSKWINTSSSATVGWGGITGTLSDQTDLQNALDGKQGVEYSTIEDWSPLVQTLAETTDGSYAEWTTLAYGDGKFVAISDHDNIAVSVSTDGVTWGTPVVVDIGSSNLAYGDGKFVSTDYDGNVYTSTDGVTWTQVTPDPYIHNTGHYWQNGMAFNGEIFVILSEDSYIATSTSGTFWTAPVENANLASLSSVVAYDEWESMAYGNGKFVALSAGGCISTSTDGTTWSVPSLISNLDTEGNWSWLRVTYGSNRFVAYGYGGRVSTSTDGVTWTPIIIPTELSSTGSTAFAYGNGTFILITNGGTLSKVSVGTTFTDVQDTLNVEFTNGQVYPLLNGSNGYILNDRINLGVTELSDFKTNGAFTSGQVLTYDENDGKWYNADPYRGDIVDVQLNGTSVVSDGVANIPIDTSKLVTTNTAQSITSTKTFVGSKKVAFKQSTSSDKLGFTLYDSSGGEKGYLEYNPTNTIDNAPLLTLGNYASSSANITQVGFRRYSGVSGAAGAYNLLTPLIADAKTPFSLTTTYQNFYLPLGVTDGTTTVKTAKSGLLDISSLLPSAITVDQTYNSTSTNAQSGTAVAGALAGAVDQTYDSTSTKAQSGVAVASAVATKSTVTFREWS